ncbi:hypothetical protein DL771_006081 [Monosporascus sp. 5C6A]|nr:hypothetical protein DL771_006081 [Monosporascus sp. 5C6A]
MLSVATALSPLIESLMVACKNAVLTDPPMPQTQIDDENILFGAPSKSPAAGLFIAFVEEHRDVLNELVREDRGLISGKFALLLKTPKVLDFEIRRHHFLRRIRPQNSQDEALSPTVQISVRRTHVFRDSIAGLLQKKAQDMNFGELHVQFDGGEDGDVRAEWFYLLVREILEPDYALFLPASADGTRFHPNLSSGVHDQHLLIFRFFGSLIGRAVYEGRAVECNFTRAFYKRILGKRPSPKDMESFDPEYSRALRWMLENDITDVIMETFSVERDSFGVIQVDDLCENGRNILVTENNKQDYVRFYRVIPAATISIFDEQELKLLISGLPFIDVDDWENNTETRASRSPTLIPPPPPPPRPIWLMIHIIALVAALSDLLFGFGSGIIATTSGHESFRITMYWPSQANAPLTGAIVSVYNAGQSIWRRFGRTLFGVFLPSCTACEAIRSQFE